MATITGNNFDQKLQWYWTPFTGTVRQDFSLHGTNEQDFIYGFGGADALYGHDGNDYLDGGTGADFMNGGMGNDTYVVDNVGDVVADDADLYHEDGTPVDAGRDRVQSYIDYTLDPEIEELELLGSLAIDGTGNTQNNWIYGNSSANILRGLQGTDELIGNGGNDELDGGIGADTMSGGEGNDSYRVDNVNDTVREFLGEGEDSVFVFSSIGAITAYTLPDNVENLTLLGNSVVRGTGNGLANEITGNSLSNTLAGGLGNDILNGLAGADTFVFNTELNRTSNVDTITDFTAGEDKIRLDSRIFDDLLVTRSGNSLRAEEFGTYTVGAPAQDSSDRIIYNSAFGMLFYDPDGTGPQAAVAFADLDGGLNLTANDFFVV
jgi:Ca2+-binding RTX toxin-like protein